MDLKLLIEKTLKIPVIELSDPIKNQCATYYLISEYPELIGDAEEQETTEMYNVDLWARKRESVVKYAGELKRVIAEFPENTIPSVNYIFDTNGKYWRAIIQFKHVKEKNNGIK